MCIDNCIKMNTQVKRDIQIRSASSADIPAMLAIYAPFVENTAVTFDTVVPTVVEFTQKIQRIQQEAPCLVCEVNGEVAGYAYASPHREKAAYRWTRELSVYIHENAKSQKYGTALYQSIIELLRCQNYRSVLAGITLPNIPSVNFHERFGFHPVGVYDNIGFKLGKAHRVGWWQLSIQDAQVPAEEIKPIAAVLGTEAGQRALRKGVSRILI